MIGWKAKFGYYPGPFSSFIGGKYSDVIFTDSSFFSIGTYCDTSNIPNLSLPLSIRHDGYYSNNQELTEALLSTLGEEYYTSYCIGEGNGGAGFSSVVKKENFELALPSIFKTCPNLANKFFSEPYATRYYVVDIVSLGVKFCFTNNTNFDSWKPLIVNDDIMSLDDSQPYSTGGIAYPNMQGGRNFSLLVCDGYDGTKESLLNIDNYKLILCGLYYSSSYRGYAVAYSPTNSSSDERSRSQQFLNKLFKNYVPPDFDVPDNPYEPGGPSGPTDPDLPPGTFDDESDPIPDSPLPTISSANTGFTRIYNPTLSQVQDLARYLWTDETVLETIWNHIKQFFENPMEAIIGFNLVPVPVPDGGTKNFALMYIDTGVQMTVAANQFVDQDCGSVKLERYYGSALDQSPYTKVSCFLPFIGTVQLNTDEVMGTTLSIKYRVDICSGSCVAKIFVDGNCLYQYSGHCAIPIPISAADFSSYVSSAISVAKLAIGAATAGAAGLAAAGATEAAQQTNQVVTTTQETTTARNPSTGRQITTGTRTVVETREAPADQSGTQASFSGMAPQNIANTVGQIMSSKPHVEHSGSFSGNTGYLGVRRPFLIIERPNMCMPASYQSMNGFPAMITMELGTCKGFTQVQQVQLTGMSATNPEQSEIMQLLKMGVII